MMEKVPCIGLIEMTLPSGLHAQDKRGSQFRKLFEKIDSFLVPEALRENLLERRLGIDKARVISYGLPEAWNVVIEKRGAENNWLLRGHDTPGSVRKTDQHLLFLGQHHSKNGDVLRTVADVWGKMTPGSELVLLLRHPSDRPELREWTLPRNCIEIDPSNHRNVLEMIKSATLVATEYSNLGYSIALTGRPVLYLFQNRGEGPQLKHLSVILGAQNKLPVKHVEHGSRNEVEEQIARAKDQAENKIVPPEAPKLDVGKLTDYLDSLSPH